VSAWLLDTLAMYGRTLGRAARLMAGNLILVVPALACLVGPLLGVVVLAPLVTAFGAFGGVVAGVLGVLLESACWSALLACTGEVIRTHRLVLNDVRAGFVAYLGDVVNVRFVVWIITFVAAGLPGPIGVMIGLATLTFFNAVPELIYLGRYGTADLLAASYRFIGERWIEWFPMNALLLGLLIAAATLVVAPIVGAAGQLPSGLTLGLGVVVTAILLAFAMLVRGLLFLELTQSSRRARAFRRALGK
jgi:hypothetical protein